MLNTFVFPSMFKLNAKMAGVKAPTIALAMVLLSMALSLQMVAATHHHVVGDDKGWDTSTDLASWASARIFKVGDNIWFDNTASQESLLELANVDEFSSCDLSNPIKMYTEDINKVFLDGEGSRYFVSGNPESCRKGLKLHINVHPQKEEETNGKDESSSEGEDVAAEYKDVTNPHGRYDPDVPEPPPSPKPKPKPPHIVPPPEEYDPDFDPEPYYPPPTPSGSTLLNVGHFSAMLAAAFLVAI
ncbi:hypothetical protein LIER_09968 [Lithospermum erythrorhizon]|uniref:Phytocyanin domain-containing protein n=1 Tax=Lithospermum erythrorhizon TaxID=34254 RepID=A0AAV3PHR6_LITER